MSAQAALSSTCSIDEASRITALSAPTADESQLLGCLIWSDSRVIEAVSAVVPCDAFSAPIDRAIYAGLWDMAAAGAIEAAALAGHVVSIGLWPRQQHAEVTARVVEVLATCVWPGSWQALARPVLDAHTRATIAVRMIALSDVVRDGSLREIQSGLEDIANLTAVRYSLLQTLRGEKQ